jgi:hypothetical protein
MTKSKEQKHAGGRKPLQPGTLRIGVTVSLPPVLHEKLQRISHGKPSAFVRAAIAAFPEDAPK